MKIIEIEEVIGNALIALLEYNKKNKVSYKQAIKYGNDVMEKLYELNETYVFSADKKSFLNLEIACLDIFNIYEEDNETYVSLRYDKSVKDLRERYRYFSTTQKIQAFTNNDSLKILGIEKEQSSKFNSQNIGEIYRVNIYGPQFYLKNVGNLYFGNNLFENGFEGIIEGMSETDTYPSYVIGKLEGDSLNFSIINSSNLIIDYSLKKSLGDNNYFGASYCYIKEEVQADFNEPIYVRLTKISKLYVRENLLLDIEKTKNEMDDYNRNLCENIIETECPNANLAKSIKKLQKVFPNKKFS